MSGPRPALVDEVPRVRLEGAPPAKTVRYLVRSADPLGRTFSSWADYRSDAAGRVDPAATPAEAGTYVGIDAWGLWWSMASMPPSEFAEGLGPVPTVVSVEVDGVVVAEAGVDRLRVGREVAVRAVGEAGLVGNVFVPPGGAGPGVVVLGGSGGGLAWSDNVAALLASRGFCALALAYFGAPGTPATLTGVAVEYVGDAVAWMLHQDHVLSPRVGAVGRSRGGELALLAGALIGDIGAVVAYAAGGVVWAGLDQASTGPDPGPAWSIAGVAHPYLLADAGAVRSATGCQPAVLAGAFAGALDDPRALGGACIDVEAIAGPVLLITGGDDQLWPAHRLAELTMRRLAARGHRGGDRHLAYPQAGHRVGAIAGLPASPAVAVHPADGIAYALGGSRRADAASGADSWPKVVRFLRRHLGGAGGRGAGGGAATGLAGLDAQAATR